MAISTGTPLLSSLGDTAGISRARRMRNRLWWSACALALTLVVAPVVWILVSITAKAMANWQWTIFTQNSTGIGGGLLNTIVGTMVLTFGTGILAGFVGVGSGIFLAEFAPKNRFSAIMRGACETLSGIPSIVFGYCGYLTLVVGLHWGYSLAPALIVLSLLVVPYIAKSTEIALQQVPVAYREGAEALGFTMPRTLRKIVLRPALPGILTGMILALAISVGETAPLLFTAGFSNSIPTGALVHEPIGYLTYATYTFYDEPVPAAQHLAADASFLLVVIVLGLILLTRLIVRLTQRYSPTRHDRQTRAMRRAAAAVASGTVLAGAGTATPGA